MQLALLDILQTYSSSNYDGEITVVSMIYASAVLVRQDFMPQFIPKPLKIDTYLIYTKSFIIFVRCLYFLFCIKVQTVRKTSFSKQ